MKQEALVTKLKGWVEGAMTVPLARHDELPHGARIFFKPEARSTVAAPAGLAGTKRIGSGLFEVWRVAGAAGMPNPEEPGSGMMRRWARECAKLEVACAKAGMVLSNRRFVRSIRLGRYGARWDMLLPSKATPPQAELLKGEA